MRDLSTAELARAGDIRPPATDPTTDDTAPTFRAPSSMSLGRPLKRPMRMSPT